MFLFNIIGVQYNTKEKRKYSKIYKLLIYLSHTYDSEEEFCVQFDVHLPCAKLIRKKCIGVVTEVCRIHFLSFS